MAQYRARTLLWVCDKLIEPGEEFTGPAGHKPGSGWEPLDDEAKAAFAAAGSPRPSEFVPQVPVASVPVDWQAAAIAAGWQPAKPAVATEAAPAAPLSHTAAPPASPPAPPAADLGGDI